MPRFCNAFSAPSRKKQLEAIGLRGNERPSPAMCACLDPSGGDWEDIDDPQPGEWLEAMIDRTPDQSFKDFASSRPNRPDVAHRTIYLLPLCDPADLEAPAFPVGPWPSWGALEDAVRRFFHPMRVAALPAEPMESLKPLPDSRQSYYGTQWHAHMVLDAIRTKLPKDAYCTLGVTMSDLYPKPEWNFVYGLARITGRVGVFSFVRHAPDRQELACHPPQWGEAQLLHRAMKTMLHEIVHMFGMTHCTFFNCMMRGSNGEGVEHQKNYLHLCPVCLRKLHSSIGFDVAAHYASMLELFEPYENDSDLFKRDCEFLRKRLVALQTLPEGATADHVAISKITGKKPAAAATPPPPAASVERRRKASVAGRRRAASKGGLLPLVATPPPGARDSEDGGDGAKRSGTPPLPSVVAPAAPRKAAAKGRPRGGAVARPTSLARARDTTEATGDLYGALE